MYSNTSVSYDKMGEQNQMDMCNHYKEKYYPDVSLDEIHKAFLEVNPDVEDIESRQFTVWDAHRRKFEKLIGVTA